MWLLNGGGALLTDFYELTMGQVYLSRGITGRASFEVTVRKLPPDWGYFVFAGMAEVEDYLHNLSFEGADIDYLRSLDKFEPEYLDYLRQLTFDVDIRSFSEGTVFFPGEPVVEVSGPLIAAQLLETYILNIIGFSVVEATMASRCMTAAGDAAVIDFGLRRCQGPISAVRVVRGAQISSWPATSNVFAAKLLDMPPSGTMAHSYVQVYEDEEQAFRDFAETYGEDAVLLVDTYDSYEGIKKAAKVAKEMDEKGVRIKGVRLDSGDFVQLSQYARKCFDEASLGFMKVFASGDMDEYKMADLLGAGAEIDGFGVGTRFGVSQGAPAISIVYKICEYEGLGLAKLSQGKESLPARKSVFRSGADCYEGDLVTSLMNQGTDLLEPFDGAEPIQTVQDRLKSQLRRLPEAVRSIRHPSEYPVEFVGFDR